MSFMIPTAPRKVPASPSFERWAVSFCALAIAASVLPGHVSAQSSRSGARREVDQTIVASQRGVVRDSAGHPIAGAVVRLCDPGAGLDSYYRGESHAVLATAETDEAGEFSFLDVKGHSRRIRGAARPNWYVIVSAAGYGVALGTPQTDAQLTRLPVELAPEATVKGRIVDENDKPVKGAIVSAVTITPLGAMPEQGRENSYLGGWHPTVETDADGRFQIQGLPAEQRIGLRIEREMFTREFVYAATTESAQRDIPRDRFLGVSTEGRVQWGPSPVHTGDFTVTLAPGWDLTGRITFADTGEPIPEARIDFSHWNYSRPTVSDADGRFRVPGIGFSTATLSVLAPEGSEYVNRQLILQFQPDQRKPTIELSLPRGVMVSGTVVDATTGKGIARVGVMDGMPFPTPDKTGVDVFSAPRTARTNAGGHFQILLPTGTRPLRVFGPVAGYDFPEEHHFSKTPIATEYQQTVEVSLDRPVPEVRFSVGRGVVITGLVLDPDGKPLEGADVGVIDDGANVVNKAKTRTDEQGKFKLSGLPPQGDLRVMIAHTERGLCGRIEIDRAHSADDAAHAGRSIVRAVKLQPGARITGLVRDANGPIAGATVTFQELNDGDPDQPQVGRIVRTEIMTDEHGRYSVDLLEPERKLLISVHMPGYKRPRGMILSIVAKSGETTEVPETILQRLK